MKNLSHVVGCLCLLASQPIWAADNTFEITPFGGYVFGGNFEQLTPASDPDAEPTRTSRELRDASSYGFLLHLIQEPGAYYELSYSRQATKLDRQQPFDLTVEHFQIGGTLDFAQPEQRIVPYMVLTLGASKFTPEDSNIDDKTAASFSLGFGVKFKIAQHVAIRTEARGYVSLLNADSDLFCRSTPAAVETDPPDVTCDIRAKSDYFVQGQAMLGVTIGF